MYDAFQSDERAHVLGFFDYCQYRSPRGSLIDHLVRRDWTEFARSYNGAGKAVQYGQRLEEAYDDARATLPR